MSSKYTRDNFLAFVASNITGENVIDLTADFEELKDLLAENNLSQDDNWVGIQFIGSEETPVDIGATNTRGTYREIGVIYIHVVAVARIGGHNAILTRAEAIRDKFRGQRIGTIIIEGVSPPNFGKGISLNFQGGYTSSTMTITYHRDLNL